MPVKMCMLCRNPVCGQKVMDGCRKAFWQRDSDAGLLAGAGRLIRSKGDMAVKGLRGGEVWILGWGRAVFWVSFLLRTPVENGTMILR